MQMMKNNNIIENKRLIFVRNSCLDGSKGLSDYFRKKKTENLLEKVAKL